MVRGEVDGAVKYDVTVTREDGLWVADVTGVEIGPAATDVPRYADLDDEVRDLIAGLTDADPDDIELTWRYIIGGEDVTDALEELVLAVEGRRVAEELYERVRQDAVRRLRDAGLTQTAIGDVLGLSHQRVHQLLRAS